MDKQSLPQPTIIRLIAGGYQNLTSVHQELVYTHLDFICIDRSYSLSRQFNNFYLFPFVFLRPNHVSFEHFYLLLQFLSILCFVLSLLFTCVEVRKINKQCSEKFRVRNNSLSGQTNNVLQVGEINAHICHSDF